MTNIYGMTRDKLIEWLTSMGVKSFKAIQIFEWLYDKRVKSFDEMTNLKKDFIEELKKNFEFGNLVIKEKQSNDTTLKYLFELSDGNLIEAVVMKHDYGNSVCVSSQIGCNMGCAFCESGRLKKVRNLNAYEMVSQILQVEEDLNIRISHIVLMGIGEPFDNYDNVIKFIDIVNEPKGIDIGARHITVSTSGLVPKINEFSNNSKQVNLAISLHAPNNKIRNEIMSVNKAYPIEQLIQSVKDYIKKTNRRVTFEYIMLDKINDTEECAKELSNLLRGINCYVNLIPYNETSHIKFKSSKKEQIMKFYDILKKNNINVTIRKEFGRKVSAACGQLRSNYEEEK